MRPLELDTKKITCDVFRIGILVPSFSEGTPLVTGSDETGLIRGE